MTFDFDPTPVPSLDDLRTMEGSAGRLKDHGLSLQGDRVVDVVCRGRTGARRFLNALRARFGYGVVDATIGRHADFVVRVVWAPEFEESEGADR